MITGEFRLNQQEIKQVINLLRGMPDKFLGLVENKFKRAALFFIGHIQETQMSGRPGLNVQSGILRNSWFPLVRRDGKDDVSSQVQTEVKYARIHQYGGIIRPVRAKVLAFTITNRVFKSSLKTRRVSEVRSARTENLVFAKQVTIPKRLHVVESFGVEGISLHVQALREAMRETVKPKGAK